MGWALLWALIIGSAATSDHTGGTAGVLAFFVIWYFADKADKIAKVGQRMLDEHQNKIDDLELLQSNSRVKKELNDI